MVKKRLAILGSTGSIGTQALQVVDQFPDRFEVVAIAAASNVGLLHEQIKKYHPRIAVLADHEAATKLHDLAKGSTTVLSGLEGLLAVATHPDVDLVLTSMVGVAGLEPTIAAIDHGKDIALANKETLVAAGELVMDLVRLRGTKILPVDSEHSAIFQCLQGQKNDGIDSVILTASGGPFRGKKADELRKVTLDRVLNHPNWNMGKKITVDSATLMNKGLEVLEAKWLFNIALDNIKVVVHPQSIIHSMVQFRDGSIVGQMGLPDMRLPIQYALLYPERLPNSFPRLDFTTCSALTFEKPDIVAFPALELAYESGRRGGTLPAVLNAANEIAVGMFLESKLPFADIVSLVADVVSRHSVNQTHLLSDVLKADAWARDTALQLAHRYL